MSKSSRIKALQARTDDLEEQGILLAAEEAKLKVERHLLVKDLKKELRRVKGTDEHDEGEPPST